jgi:hypothetical protein
MRRDLGIVLFLYIILGAVVSAPIPEIESSQSPDEVSEEMFTFAFECEIQALKSVTMNANVFWDAKLSTFRRSCYFCLHDYDP